MGEVGALSRNTNIRVDIRKKVDIYIKVSYDETKRIFQLLSSWHSYCNADHKNATHAVSEVELKVQF